MSQYSLHWTPIRTPLSIATVHLYLYPSYACTNRHHKYARSQSTPVFVKHRISTRRCKSFGMFAERSTCYFCLSSVPARGLVFPFQSVHSSQVVPLASQDGFFRLCKAENPCLLLLQEKLHGNRLLFNRRRILG